MANEELTNSHFNRMLASYLARESAGDNHVPSRQVSQTGIVQTHLPRSDLNNSRVSYQLSSGYNSTHESALLRSNGYNSSLSFGQGNLTSISRNVGNSLPELYNQGYGSLMLNREENVPVRLYSGYHQPMLFSEGNYRPVLHREDNYSVTLNIDGNDQVVLYSHGTDNVLSHRPSRLGLSRIDSHLDIQASSRSSNANSEQAQAVSGEFHQSVVDRQRFEIAGDQNTDRGDVTEEHQNTDRGGVTEEQQNTGRCFVTEEHQNTDSGDVIKEHKNTDSGDVTEELKNNDSGDDTEQKRHCFMLDAGEDQRQQNTISTPNISTPGNIGQRMGESEIPRNGEPCDSLEFGVNWRNLIAELSQQNVSPADTISYSDGEQWTHRHIVGTEGTPTEQTESEARGTRSTELSCNSLRVVNDRLPQDVPLRDCSDRRSSYTDAQNLSWGSNQQLQCDQNISWGSYQQLSYDQNISWRSNQQLSYDQNISWGSYQQLSYDQNISWGSNQQLLDDQNISWGSNQQLLDDQNRRESYAEFRSTGRASSGLTENNSTRRSTHNEPIRVNLYNSVRNSTPSDPGLVAQGNSCDNQRDLTRLQDSSTYRLGNSYSWPGFVTQATGRESHRDFIRFDNRSTENSYQHGSGYTVSGLRLVAQESCLNSQYGSSYTVSGLRLVAQESCLNSQINLTRIQDRSTENSYQHSLSYTVSGLRLVAQESCLNNQHSSSYTVSGLRLVAQESCLNNQHSLSYTVSGLRLVAQESCLNNQVNLTRIQDRSTENSYQRNLMNTTVEASSSVRTRHRGNQYEFESLGGRSTENRHPRGARSNAPGLSVEARRVNIDPSLLAQPAADVVGALNRPAVNIGIVLRRNINDPQSDMADLGRHYYHEQHVDGAIGGIDPQNPPYPTSTDTDIHPDVHIHVNQDEPMFIDLAGSRIESRDAGKCATCFKNPRQTRHYPCGCICNCLDCSAVMYVCAICQGHITHYEAL